ncbi:NosD domain-containing protein [Haladaptatus sp. NG-SE-30]
MAVDIGQSQLRTAILVSGLVVVLGVTTYAGIHLVGTETTDSQNVSEIDSCTTIDEPGRYELTADIRDSSANKCIRIASSNVVFSGNGHSIDGTGAFGTGGVLVGSFDASISNVTVRNVNVTDWDDGIRYIHVVNGTVTNTVTANNRVGLTLLSSNQTTVVNNTATKNAVYGISLQETSHHNAVANNTATANSLFGIHLVRSGVRNNTIASNAASKNEYGIVLIGANANTVINNSATANRIAGIWLSEADDNRLSNNTVSNRFYGLYLGDQSNRNRLSTNTASQNAVGIRLLHSDNNAITGNTVTDSRVQGILLIASNNGLITDNQLSNNSDAIALKRSKNITRSTNSSQNRFDEKIDAGGQHWT